MNWVLRCDEETNDMFIMWLTGAAGAGKSAIAQSFIELCLLHGLVIASFFFGRLDGSRNHPGAFIATIVYQIYTSVPATQKHILAVINADPLILTRSLEHQFTQLVAKPLSSAYYSGNSWLFGFYPVIVIDGLDECLDKEAQKEILRILSHGIHQFNLPVLFLIASRPEHDIRVAFGSHRMQGIYKRLYLDDTFHPDEDIRAFLKDSFENIRTSHPFKSSLPVVWPTQNSIETLVQKSSGQFIFAATVVRCVQSIYHQPHDRLEMMLSLRPPQGNLPFAQLDVLYSMILSSAANIDLVLYALSIYSHHVVDERFCTLDLERFLNLREGELDILFCDLGALVSIERIENYEYGPSIKMLRILHASLHDFLLDSMRSGRFFIDINVYRTAHLDNILRYLTLGKRPLLYIYCH